MIVRTPVVVGVWPLAGLASVGLVNVDVVDDRRHGERVLLEDADQRLVVIDAEGAAEDGVAVARQVVGHAGARLPAVLLELVDARRRTAS